MRSRPGFEWLLAWRILRSRKSRFLSVITVVAIVGIAFGVLMLTIVLGVTGGFQEAFRERILGLHPHLLVWPMDDRFDDYREARDDLMRHPNIVGATPATYDEIMIAHGERRAGAVLKGVEVDTVSAVMDIDALLLSGALAGLDETPNVTREGDDFVMSTPVQETSWTAVVYGPDQVALHADEGGAPMPDQAHLFVINARAGPPIDVALVGGQEALVSALEAGAKSGVVVLPAGEATLRLGTGSLPGGEVRIEGGKSYLFVLTPGDGRLLPIRRGRPAADRARVRVVDVRGAGAKPVAVRVGDVRIQPGADEIVPARRPGVILGSALAKRLRVEAGDAVALSSPWRGIEGRGAAPMGMEPSQGRFEVVGLFRSGYYDYDKRFALVGFPAALRFLGTGDRARWLEVRTTDAMDTERGRQAANDVLQPYSAATFTEDIARVHTRLDAVLSGDITQFDVERSPKSVLGLLRNSSQALTMLRTGIYDAFSRETHHQIITWEEVNGPLFQALELQKLVLTIFFLIIIVVAAFNIVGTQIMMVHQKTREIAILKALGADRWMVRRVFLIQGFFVASVGTLLGLIAGLGAGWLLDEIGYPLEPEVYLISELPVVMDLGEISIVCCAALALVFLATLYSAGRAARLMPVEGIRYIE